MITTGELMRQLKAYPLDTPCYAYEGESIGIMIVNTHDITTAKEIGFIEASP